MAAAFKKHPGQNAATKTMHSNIYPFSKIYALGTVFQNIRIPPFQGEGKAELDKLLSVFIFIWVRQTS